MKSERAQSSFVSFKTENNFNTCRLVQYSGPEIAGAIDIDIEEILNQINGLICEGFDIEWAVKDNVCFLKVWEYPGSIPDWSKVFQEKDLMEIPDFDE